MNKLKTEEIVPPATRAEQSLVLGFNMLIYLVSGYSGFHLGTAKVKTEDKKYGFDGLQVVRDNLQTAIIID